MSIYKDQIEHFLYEQRQLLDIYEKELRQSPEGVLICSTNKGKPYYYHSVDDKGSHVRKPLSKHPDMVRDLARKEFLRRSVEALKSNIRLLENVDRHYMDEQFDALQSRMHKAYRGLPAEYFLGSDVQSTYMYHAGDEYSKRRHAAWAKSQYEKSDYKPENLRFPTSAGIYVRSKSEQHIVEQLCKYGVPFRYEQVLHLENGSYSADFTFEGYDEEWFFWEHAGMMDVGDYAERHHRKMIIFERCGITPWKNLIVTYDMDGVINVPMINSIIENEVIPRL